MTALGGACARLSRAGVSLKELSGGAPPLRMVGSARPCMQVSNQHLGLRSGHEGGSAPQGQDQRRVSARNPGSPDQRARTGGRRLVGHRHAPGPASGFRVRQDKSSYHVPGTARGACAHSLVWSSRPPCERLPGLYPLHGGGNGSKHRGGLKGCPRAGICPCSVPTQTMCVTYDKPL